ncbi:putative Actin-binding protein [Blattamonas nauphoetae]|uniref:Coronin n=1 Tax=Blattamonas nauphoetae TaxID=2049346 RepID=A0ABQ9XHC4_9EUKA|nr:putative Actin-binding protein [Blattamonas nauphoetae]
MSIVRKSKYRHVFGSIPKREFFYEDLKGSTASLDTNMIKINNKFISYIMEGSGGGAIALFPISDVGRRKNPWPAVRGHTRPVTDMDFSPFNPYVLATTSEDCLVRVFNIPENGIADGESLSEAAVTMHAHGRKASELLWNPAASNILASSGADQIIKIWDVEKGSNTINLEGFEDMIQGFAWNAKGNEIAVQSRDKKVRVFDVRANTVTHDLESHKGSKTSRLCYNNSRNWVLSTGFGQGSDRELTIWDLANTSKPLFHQKLDQSSGVIMPFFDEGTQILFLASKGESNIKYYELVGDAPFCHYISTFGEGTPVRGITALPKVYVNTRTCEIMKFYKLTSKQSIEPVSFTVPRRSEMFQDDIYPDTHDTTRPAMTASEWNSGAIKDLPMFKFTAEGNPDFIDPVALASGSAPSPMDSRSPNPAVAAVGRVGASSEDKAKVAELEAELAAKDQEIAALKKELEELKASQ